MHRERISEDVGRARIDPADQVEVASSGSWTITFTAGRRGVAVGGKVRIMIPHGFTAPQCDAFFDPGFTTVDSTPEGVDVVLDIVSGIFCRLDPKTGHSGAWGRSVFATVEGRGLEAGESFSILYGNADYYGREPFGHAGAQARELSGPAEFTVAVDPDGKRDAPYSGFIRVTASPVLEVLPGKPETTRGIVPSDVLRGAPVEATLITLDRFNNPVDVSREKTDLPEGDVIRVRMIHDGRSAKTNPVRIHDAAPATRVFWGDIHGHTIQSDGLGTLDEYYAFARDVARLDFAAVTDHDDIGPRLSEEEWDRTRAATAAANDPGRFVTLLGYEYRNGLCDMNVYYPGADGPLLRGSDGELKDAAELARHIRNASGVIVPHMHFGADWSGFDPEVHRVLEIYSQHGSAEHRGCPREIPYLRRQLQKSSASNRDCYVQDALATGRRLGFTAGSDTHSGRPGLSDWTRVCRTYPGGLTAVLAGELIRETIWQALRDRRCYATTGNRSLVEFSVNDASMGSEIAVEKSAPRRIALACHADGELAHLTVFRSGRAWIDEAVSGESLVRELVDEDQIDGDWYYVRLILRDGGMIWTSPVWLDVV